jgi:RimJ/RimL family protein N-acetyltransferase
MADRAHVRAWIEKNLRLYEEFGHGLWAVEAKESGMFLGDCGLTYQEADESKELEVGYHLLHAARGKGYASEAASACLDFGFQRTAASLVCSIVAFENAASRAVAGRLHPNVRETIGVKGPALFYFTRREEWVRRSA